MENSMTEAFLENSGISLGNLELTTNLLGTGKTSTILAHPLLSNECIKLYRTPEIAAKYAEKITAMILNKPKDIHTRISESNAGHMLWPLDRVIDINGQFLGFTMPLIDFKNTWPGTSILHPIIKKHKGIPLGQRLNLVIALNIARSVQSLHNTGHYIVDLNSEKFLVYNTTVHNKTGCVVMLECDEFRVADSQKGKKFRAELVTSGYMHPKAYRSANAIDWVNENPHEQDLWAAATLFFQLLNLNLHPMQGIGRPGQNTPNTFEEKLRDAANYYPYGIIPSKILDPNKESLHLWMDDSLRNLFDDTFLERRTPTLPEWIDVLTRLNDENYRCSKNTNHWKFGLTCGLCHLEVEKLLPNKSDIAISRELLLENPPAIPVLRMGAIDIDPIDTEISSTNWKNLEILKLPRRQKSLVDQIIVSLGSNHPTTRKALSIYSEEINQDKNDILIEIIKEAHLTAAAGIGQAQREGAFDDDIMQAWSTFESNNITYMNNFSLSLKRDDIYTRVRLSEEVNAQEIANSFHKFLNVISSDEVKEIIGPQLYRWAEICSMGSEAIADKSRQLLDFNSEISVQIWMRRQVSKSWILAVKIKNLIDSKYLEIDGYLKGESGARFNRIAQFSAAITALISLLGGAML